MVIEDLKDIPKSKPTHKKNAASELIYSKNRMQIKPLIKVKDSKFTSEEKIDVIIDDNFEDHMSL